MELAFKLTILILTINSFSACKSEILPIKPYESAILNAVDGIFKVSFSKYSNIHIISRYQNNTFDDIVSKLISMSIKNSKVAVENTKSFNEQLRRNAAIIVMDSRDAVLDFVGKVKNIEKRGRYLIIFPNALHADLKAIFTVLWKSNIFNVGILTETADEIKWNTFLPFDAGKCGDTSPKTVSTFIKRDQLWENSLFFPRKLKNLNGCDLKIGTFYTIPTAIVVNGTVHGSEADALINIGKIMNFRPKYFIYSQESGVVFNNGTATGLMQRAMNREVDIIHGFLSLQHLRAKFLTASKAFAQVPLAIVVPPGDFLTPFDKIFYPFSPGIWYALVAMYIVVFTVIGIFDTYFKDSYNFLVGKDIKNPFMSMLIVCLGYTQHKLPGRNFSRFTLMNFMIFWIVVRTCYQGVLFNLLQKELRTKEVQSIDEMLEKNFKFYVYNSLASRTENTSFIKKRVIIKLEQLEEYREKTLDPNFDGVVLSYLTQVLYLNKMNRKNFTYTICKQKFINNRMVFYVTKDFYLIDELNSKITALMENGLMNYWRLKYLDFSINQVAVVEGPKPLSLYELLGSFKIYVGGSLICICAFVLEKLSMKIESLKKLFK